MKKALVVFILLINLLSYSCGTIMQRDALFIERSDSIDYNVFVLDGMGFLFLFVPGVVLMGIDYMTGTLFLTKEDEMAKNSTFHNGIVVDLIVD